MTLPVIQLSGAPYSQGVQHGRALRDRIAHNLEVYFDRFWREANVPRDEVLARSRLYSEAIRKANAAYYAGMQGIAAGSGFSMDEIGALTVRYEILYYHRVLVGQSGQAVDGCTAFAIAPADSANGHLLLGQNWDWIPEVAGAIVRTTQEDGLESLAFTEAGIFGGKIGLNSAGLGLTVTGITSTSDDWTRLTAPFHVRCYDILRRHRLDEARAVVADERRSCSANYLIAQAPDRVLNIEAAPDDLNQLSWEDGCVVHTNHFVDPEAIGVSEPEPEYRGFSCRRRERMQGLLAERRPISITDLQVMLRDHVNSPRSICRHEVLTAPVDEQYRTVTGIIMDLEERLLYITDGPPCENGFERHSLSM